MTTEQRKAYDKARYKKQRSKLLRNASTLNEVYRRKSGGSIRNFKSKPVCQ